MNYEFLYRPQNMVLSFFLRVFSIAPPVNVRLSGVKFFVSHLLTLTFKSFPVPRFYTSVQKYSLLPNIPW